MEHGQAAIIAADSVVQPDQHVAAIERLHQWPVETDDATTESHFLIEHRLWLAPRPLQVRAGQPAILDEDFEKHRPFKAPAAAADKAHDSTVLIVGESVHEIGEFRHSSTAISNIVQFT
jgi:hypothetical protein